MGHYLYTFCMKILVFLLVIPVAVRCQKVGQAMDGGVIFRMDLSGKHGWIVKEVGKEISFDEIKKTADSTWRLPTYTDWVTVNGKPGIIDLKVAGGIKLSNIYYWIAGPGTTTAAPGITVSGNYSTITLSKDKSRVGLALIERF